MSISRRFWTNKEDATLRQLAGVKPASEIAAILGRPKNGVHHRISKLGLDGRLTGELHWNARLSNLSAGMIGALYDAGYTVNEIHRVMNDGLGVSLSQVNAVAACRSRRSA